MRKILVALLVLFSFCAKAQILYNNEWIDYSQTYYKFRVGRDGVYRISGAALAAAGLGAASAQNFQLWRNGVQVPIYISVASGTLSSSDYIEFWGKMNDGKPDKELYREAGFQLNDKWSLISDSAAYFLTASPSGLHLRLQSTANNVAGNTLPAEPYFMHTAGHYFKDKVNSGLFYTVGSDHLFSSSYDQGEGWTSGDIGRNATLPVNSFVNLFPASSGPAPTIKASVSGNAYNSRRYKVTLNGDSVLGNPVPYMNQSKDEGTFNLSLLSSGSASVGITNMTDDCGASSCPADWMVAHKLEITYPRQFNFGGAPNFEFTLPASVTGNYLEIAGVGHGGVAPVLYDLTNGKRYVGEISGSLIRVVLESSATDRSLVLVSQVGTNISLINSLSARTFTNYNVIANQADYLIISNPLLFNGVNGNNPVEEYRSYRSSGPGGGYNAKIFLDEQLIDQFGFGIKKNPAGIRNFIRFARNKFATKPKQVFLIGRGMHYVHQRSVYDGGNQTQKENLEKLNLVPSFGWPASDLLLSAEPGTSVPATPIGRLTAITPAEVSTYLKKVKDLEQAQQSLSPSIEDKAWMKNFAHIAGAGEEPLASLLVSYLNGYKRIIEDTLYGAKVFSFNKTSTNLVEQLNDADLVNLFNKGISVLTYYGHSSPTTLEFNLDDPGNYNNQGKYPMFLALGCNAGNTFDYNEGRFFSRTYLSDKYVLAPDRGSINFIASTHFGIVHYLDIWNARAYTNMARHQYGSTIGEIMKKTTEDVFGFTSPDDFFARCNSEEIILNGDPAIRLNQQPKPDYVVTNDMVTISPVFVSVADQSFKVKVGLVNLGKAIGQNIVIETKREFPDQKVEVIRRDTIKGVRFSDSLNFTVGIDPIRDKGSNKIILTIDPENTIDELFKTNNAAIKDFVVYEEEARPIYPQNFTIVNKAKITFKASTANPFGELKQYQMEIDTTQNFNSPLKSASTISSTGGLLEFTPPINLVENVVYYWRVAPMNSNNVFNWNSASFIYINNSTNGYNQSHYYQHTKSSTSQMVLDPGSRKWRYDSVLNNLTMRNGLFGTATGQEGDLTVSVNGSSFIRSACVGFSLIFNVFNPNTFKPDLNTNGKYGSALPCLPSRQWNYEFSYMTAGSRKKIMDFMDSIPDGSIVVVRNILNVSQAGGFVNDWKNDETVYGGGNSLYHKLKQVGFNDIDSFNFARAFSFVYQKGNNKFIPVSLFSAGAYDVLNHSVNIKTIDSVGYLVSPIFGPAKNWKELVWRGNTLEANSADNPKISIIGIQTSGVTDTLVTGIGLSDQNYDISNINAATYPNLQLVMRNIDSVDFTPYQLSYWRLIYDPVPEGVLAPNIYLKVKDTVEVGEPLEFQIAFKNITDSPFADSMDVKMVVTDRNNVQRILNVPRFKKLNADDTLTVSYSISTKDLAGLNTLFIDINPNNAQQEQFHFNNFAYRNFYVRGDTLNPLLDVTFDNVHILNRDIVSSKPNIEIKVKDEAKWMLLNDTSIATVQVRFPNGAIKTYQYNSDTLTLVPASGMANESNTAIIRLRPFFGEDGDYELIVHGKDMSNNEAGKMSYRVGFQVINKPMISNLLNYPNPFTTSTAFVFTLTGSEVPQNIKIEILTVTGRIVREITKDELGPLQIGRNITEFKWDGTDQFGQRLANGVYLYRVVTNLNGKSLDKYTSSQDDTDKYFNKGYGKMYLLR